MKIKTNQSHPEDILKILLLFILMFFTTLTFAQINDHSKAVNKAAVKIEQKVIEWRHDIHQNPELGNREF
jgi:hypothetical protein